MAQRHEAAARPHPFDAAVTRWLSLVAGVALLILAFIAYTRIADTREGLIAEAILLLAGGTGLTLAIYGLSARDRRSSAGTSDTRQASEPATRTRPPRDLALGAAGILLSVVLLTGLAVSGGFLWAGLGFLLLLPMLAGSVYLCWRSIRMNL